VLTSFKTMHIRGNQLARSGREITSTLIFHLTSLQPKSEIINMLRENMNSFINAKKACSPWSNTESYPCQ